MRKFNVHKDRIWRQFLGHKAALRDSRGLNRRLNDNKDHILYKYISFIDNISLIISDKTFITTINLIL